MTDIDVVVEPTDNRAGVGVVHEPDVASGAPMAEYQVLQLWPSGDAETIHVGDGGDCAALIEALAAALQEGQR